MKRFGMALLLACCVGLVGCDDAKKKAGDAKDATEKGVKDVKDKASAGDAKGAVEAGKEGAKDVKDAVTGDKK